MDTEHPHQVPQHICILSPAVAQKKARLAKQQAETDKRNKEKAARRAAVLAASEKTKKVVGTFFRDFVLVSFCGAGLLRVVVFNIIWGLYCRMCSMFLLVLRFPAGRSGCRCR